MNVSNRLGAKVAITDRRLCFCIHLDRSGFENRIGLNHLRLRVDAQVSKSAGGLAVVPYALQKGVRHLLYTAIIEIPMPPAFNRVKRHVRANGGQRIMQQRALMMWD